MAAEVLQEKNSETTNTELQFNTLIPFKNHLLEHFMSALKFVMSDQNLATKQTDPI